MGTRRAGSWGGGHTMDPKEGHAQIDYMRQFILHEAREQASEIDAKADQEFHNEKQRLYELQRKKTDAENERRLNEVQTNQKIHDSNIHNRKKLEVLEAKNKLVEDAFRAAAAELKSKSGDAAVIEGLIRQGLLSFKEGSKIKVRCRKQDESVTKGAIAKFPGVEFSSNSITKSNACTLVGFGCLGGVILTNDDETVVVDQTFNARLATCFERAVPMIKPVLFGEGGSKHY